MKTRFFIIAASILLIGFGSFMVFDNIKKYVEGKELTKSVPLPAVPKKVEQIGYSWDQNEEPHYNKIYQQGDQIGYLRIPKLSASLPIIEGTDEDELAKGVGHVAESVMPGMKDNSVLAGHRDTVFRRLGEVGVGDILQVDTSAGKFIYRVNNVRIVAKDDRTVIVRKPKAVLTVITCYPFHYIGAAPKRYVLSADLIKREK